MKSRTHSWQDSAATPDAAGEASGFELLSALARGDLLAPPIMSTLGFDGFAVGSGWAKFTRMPDNHLYNPNGTVHGGVAATLLDSAMSRAVHSTLDKGVGYTTVDLQVSFVRPLTTQTGSSAPRGHRGPRRLSHRHRRRANRRR